MPHEFCRTENGNSFELTKREQIVRRISPSSRATRNARPGTECSDKRALTTTLVSITYRGLLFIKDRLQSFLRQTSLLGSACDFPHHFLQRSARTRGVLDPQTDEQVEFPPILFRGRLVGFGSLGVQGDGDLTIRHERFVLRYPTTRFYYGPSQKICNIR